MALLAGFWVSLYFENFEGGSLPPGWEVVDGDSNGVQWQVWPSDSLYPDLPPDSGSWVLAYRDELVELPNYGTPGEEARSPSVYAGGHDPVLVRLGVAFREFYGKDTFLVYTLEFQGDTWAFGDTLIFAPGDLLPGLDTAFTLGGAESLRVCFRWWTPRWDHRYQHVVVDNLEILGWTPASRDLSLLDAGPRGSVQGGFGPWVLVANSGSQPAESLVLALEISDSSGPLHSDTFKAHLALQPGETLRVPFPAWEPPSPGFYWLRFYNLLPDENPSDDTLRTRALAAPQVVRQVRVQPGTITVDGDVGDWYSFAPSWEISDFLGRDSIDWGRRAMALWDGQFLYLAVEAPPAETVLVAINDDASGRWPSDSSQGFNLFTQDSWLSAWILDDYTWSSWFPSGLSSFARGPRWLEVAFPVVSSDSGPQFLEQGDSLRLLVASWSGDTACFWPQDAPAWHKPGAYGVFELVPVEVREGGEALPLRVWGARGAIEGWAWGLLEIYEPTGRLAARFEARGSFRVPLRRGVYLVKFKKGGSRAALVVY